MLFINVIREPISDQLEWFWVERWGWAPSHRTHENLTLWMINVSKIPPLPFARSRPINAYTYNTLRFELSSCSQWTPHSMLQILWLENLILIRSNCLMKVLACSFKKRPSKSVEMWIFLLLQENNCTFKSTLCFIFTSRCQDWDQGDWQVLPGEVITLRFLGCFFSRRLALIPSCVISKK